MKFNAIALVLLLISGTLHAQRTPIGGGAPAGARIVVVSSDDNGVTLDVSGLRASVDRRDGITRIVHNAPLFASFGDSLSLPGLLVTLGVPDGATGFKATVTPGSYDTLTLPAPSIGYRTAIPAGTATVQAPILMRGLSTVALRYQPLRVEGGKVIAERSARIVLTWTRGAGAGKGSAGYSESPSMENVLRSQILNYDLAKRWRVAVRKSRTTLASSGWGMERGVVLGTGRDGVYGASGSELAASGAQGVLGAPIGALRLRNRSSYVSFYVDDRDGNGLLDANDYVEFEGRRNPSSEGFYFDDVTDTNAYVLSWSGGGGEAPALLPKDGHAAAPAMVAYDSTLHFERELVYYGGSSVVENGERYTLYVSERVRGERLYWERIVYPFQSQVEFSCSPYYAPGGRAKLRMRMLGITDTTHYFDIQLNGSLVGSVAVRDTADTVIELDIPVSHLVNGRNVMSFVPKPPPGVSPNDHSYADHVHLDYIEISGRWLPSAFDDAPKVSLSVDGPGPRRVSITGLSEPPTRAISGTSRVQIDSVERGNLFRLTSREFDDVALRQAPGFFAQFADTSLASPLYGVGLMLVEADGATGRLSRSEFYSLDPKNDAALADAVRFLGDIRDGNIVIAGLSVGTSSTPFSQELKDALAQLGSTSAAAPNFVAGWLFAVRKGAPATAVERYAPYTPGDPGLTLNAFFPSLDGGSYRAAVTLDGAARDEFQIGHALTPTMRYHAADLLVGTANRADMLIISHPDFFADANRLAAHRKIHDSLNVNVVDVNAIYDEFNNGVKAPIAIRRFLQYADTNWTAPAPGYVLLFGDASWDAANRFGRSGNADFVPTNGIPASDYLYTVAIGDNTMMWHQLIGRLSVASPSDARSVVDKLIEYDTLAPAAWNKRFVFMAGGSSVQQVEDQHYEDLGFATQYVLSPYFRGDTAMIKRTSTNLIYPDSKDAPWAHDEINKGALWVSFTGHGYTDGFDLDFGYPEQLDNDDRYFVLGTFSCQTGAFAEPGLPVRNERFVNFPGKGAVAAIGETSFSMPSVDQAMKDGFYSLITEGHERVIGSIFTRAKYDRMFRDYAVGWEWSADGQDHRNALVAYNLLGDPAMKLTFRNTVELGFSDIRLANESDGEPVPGDSVVKVHARLWNYGTPPKSQASVTVKTVATIVDGAQHRFTDTVEATIGSYADLVLTLPLGMTPGEYTIQLDADPGRTVGETYLPDNDTTLVLRVRGNQPLPIEPLPYGRVAGYDNVVIRLVNPPGGAGAEITVDTSDAFNPASSISSNTTGTMQLEELTTTWTFSIPQSLRSARKFWWRAVSTRDTAISNLFPLVETFTVDEAGGKEYIVGGMGQMKDARIVNLVNDPIGIGPGERPVPILVTSMGQSRYSPSDPVVVPRTFAFVRVDGAEQNNPALDNLNVLVLDSGRVRDHQAFAIYQGGAQVAGFVNMVNSIPPGLTVLVWANGASFNDSGAYPSAAVRGGLKMLGSTKADSLGEEDSYVLIGGKGIDPSRIRESWVPAAPLRAQNVSPPYYASASDTIVAPAGPGTLIAPVVGPATAWRSVQLSRTGNGQLRATVFGVSRSGARDSLFTADAVGPISLAGVDVGRYPRLEIHALFPSDTTLRLGSIGVDFDPSPELALVPSTARLEHDSVLQGDNGIYQATLVNLSRKYAADSVVVRLASTDPTQAKPYDSLVVAHLNPLDSARYGYSIATERLKGYNGFRLFANPTDHPAEPYQQNNVLETTLRVGLDNVSPELTIFADGSRMMDGDYVNPQPTFEIRIFDNSSLRLDDSSTVEMILDNDIIRLGAPGTGFQTASEKGSLRATFSYRPDTALANGRHEMRLAITDASGNVDTTDFIPFFVERDLNIHNVVNFPNPFVNTTTFTFMVGGARTPRSGEIAIFTVAGRRIKTIRLGASQLNIGFNRIDWDGLDDDHDRLANGVYLYRVTVDNGDAKQEIIEKLVVMR